MGAGSSTAAAVHIYPLNFTEDKPAERDSYIAKKVWEMILSNTGTHFQEMKKNPEFDKISCLSWYYEAFYERLFDIHPSCRSQFKQNMTSQGKALVKMISAALGLLYNPKSLTSTLENLSKMHTARGVMSNQYGIVGECLLWTFTKVLGDEFTEEANTAWIRIYSFMIDIMIRSALVEEIKSFNAAKKIDPSFKSLSHSNSVVELKNISRKNSDIDSKANSSWSAKFGLDKSTHQHSLSRSNSRSTSTKEMNNNEGIVENKNSATIAVIPTRKNNEIEIEINKTLDLLNEMDIKDTGIDTTHHIDATEKSLISAATTTTSDLEVV